MYGIASLLGDAALGALPIIAGGAAVKYGPSLARGAHSALGKPLSGVTNYFQTQAGKSAAEDVGVSNVALLLVPEDVAHFVLAAAVAVGGADTLIKIPGRPSIEETVNILVLVYKQDGGQRRISTQLNDIIKAFVMLVNHQKMQNQVAQLGISSVFRARIRPAITADALWTASALMFLQHKEQVRTQLIKLAEAKMREFADDTFAAYMFTMINTGGGKDSNIGFLTDWVGDINRVSKSLPENSPNRPILRTFRNYIGNEVGKAASDAQKYTIINVLPHKEVSNVINQLAPAAQEVRLGEGGGSQSSQYGYGGDDDSFGSPSSQSSEYASALGSENGAGDILAYSTLLGGGGAGAGAFGSSNIFASQPLITGDPSANSYRIEQAATKSLYFIQGSGSNAIVFAANPQDSARNAIPVMSLARYKEIDDGADSEYKAKFLLGVATVGLGAAVAAASGIGILLARNASKIPDADEEDMTETEQSAAKASRAAKFALLWKVLLAILVIAAGASLFGAWKLKKDNESKTARKKSSISKRLQYYYDSSSADSDVVAGELAKGVKTMAQLQKSFLEAAKLSASKSKSTSSMYSGSIPSYLTSSASQRNPLLSNTNF